MRSPRSPGRSSVGWGEAATPGGWRRGNAVLLGMVALVVLLLLPSSQRSPCEHSASASPCLLAYDDASLGPPVGAEELVAELMQRWAQQSRVDAPPMLPTRQVTLPGSVVTVTLLHNAARAHKRKTALQTVLQDSLAAEQERAVQLDLPFDASGRGFNFNKVGANELLFRFQRLPAARDTSPAAAPGLHTCCPLPVGGEAEMAAEVLLNASPLSRFSGLLVPFAREQRNQVLTADALLVGLHFAHLLGTTAASAALASRPLFRLGYNSLAAGASVNHLHFQFWQTNWPLAVEQVQTRLRARVATPGGGAALQIRQAHADYPLPFLAFAGLGPTSLSQAAHLVHSCTRHCLEAGIPHNLVLTASHVFLVPRRPNVRVGSMTPGFPEVVCLLKRQGLLICFSLAVLLIPAPPHPKTDGLADCA